MRELFAARKAANISQTELNDLVQARDGIYTEEEQTRWDEADKDWKSLTDQIQRAEELRRRESILDDAVDEHVERTVVPEGEDRQVGNVVESKEYRDLFGHYCRTGEMTAEFRHMQGEAGGDSGGYAVTPQTILAGIWEKARSDCFGRNHARVIPVPTAESLGVITL
ncbi:MAG: phage major capsid protein, partial [Chloroflexi bacterium]